MARLAFDIETDGFLEDLTVVHSLVVQDPDTGQMWSCHDQPTYGPRGASTIHSQDEPPREVTTIARGLEMLERADQMIGHNIIKYDIPALEKVYPQFKPRGQAFDTLVCSRLIWTSIADYDQGQSKRGKFPGKLIGSHGLEAWGIRLGEWKGDYAKKMEEQGLDPWAAWNLEMQEYCEQDVIVTIKLLERIEKQNYSQQALDLEHAFATIIAMQERYGFGFDEAKAIELYNTLIKRRLEIASELQEAFPPQTVEEVFIPKANNRKMGYVKGQPFIKTKVVEFNPSSRQMIGQRLKEMGWEPEEFTPSGQPKIDETILSKLPYREAKVLAEHFLVEKRIGQLAEGDQAWLRLVRKGRIHGGVNTNGAVTGRCTHSRPNVAQTPGVGAPYGAECRALFGVSKGRKLVGADLSGLELRCLAHFMARYDDGAYGRLLLTGDVHWANVEALGLVPPGTQRDEDNHPIHKLFRDGAKTFIYGFLYGAGDVKIGSIILDIAMREVRDGLGESTFKRYFKGNRSPTEDTLRQVGKKLKQTFLDRTPAIARLRKAVTGAAERGYLIGLDGRKLHIRSAHAALNTLLQSAGALIAKQATVFAYEELSTGGYVFGRDYALVAHIHDEVQVDCREAIAEQVGQTLVQSMRKAGEHFNFRCPIDGEYKIGNNWRETH